MALVRRSMVAALAGLTLMWAGCSTSGSEPSDDRTVPSPTQVRAPSPSPDDPAGAARSAALAAYTGMWQAYDQAGRAPAADPDDPALAQATTGDALEGLMAALGRLRDQGLVFEGTFELTATELVELSPADAPTSAKIEDCLDESGWEVVSADGGEYEDEPGGRRAVFADVELGDDGVWRVTGFALRAVGTC